MITYTADRQNPWPYILKIWSIPVVIFLLAVGYDYFYPSDFAKGFYWAFGFVSLARFVDLISRNRIYKIVIDEERETFSQYYRSPMSGKGEKTILLEHIRVYLKPPGSSPGNPPRSIEFYKGYRRVFKLDKNTDGFSPATLQEIRQTLEKLGMRITE